MTDRPTSGRTVPRETARSGERPSAEKVREAVSDAAASAGAGVLGAGEVLYPGGDEGLTPIAEEAARAARVLHPEDHRLPRPSPRDPDRLYA